MKSKYIESSEIKKLESFSRADAWLLFRVSLETGLRIGDVVKLKRSNVKDDGIHYRAQKTNKNGIAPISAALRRELLAKRGKWLFPSPYKHGEHITRQCAWARIKRACELAEIDSEGISPHSMRKVFAVELYREKGFKAVQEALQHRNTATTEIYSFADWSTGANADKPLCRKDLALIIRMVVEALGDARELPNESRSKKSAGTGASKIAPAAEGARKPRKKRL